MPFNLILFYSLVGFGKQKEKNMEPLFSSNISSLLQSTIYVV